MANKIVFVIGFLTFQKRTNEVSKILIRDRAYLIFNMNKIIHR